MIVETIKSDDGRIAGHIHTDDDPESPREWDCLGKMVCWHSRYNLGDEQPTESASKWLANLAIELHESIPDVK